MANMQDIEQERAKFESCHELRHCDFERNKDLAYTSAATRCAWIAWQTGAQWQASRAAPVAPEQPAQEWLTDEQIIQMAKKRFGWAAGLGGFDDAVLGFARALLASQPATPVEAAAPVQAMTDERINQLWECLDGKKIIAGENQLNWNRVLRIAFARAIIAAERGDA